MQKWLSVASENVPNKLAVFYIIQQIYFVLLRIAFLSNDGQTFSN